MPPPLIVSIPHRLGRDEATRRLKSGLETARTKLGQIFAIEEETWTDNRRSARPPTARSMSPKITRGWK